MTNAVPKLFLSIIFSLLILKTLGETHVVLDQLDKTVINFVADSPFAIRQPHSLVDFLNQIQWVHELSKSYSSVKRQQVSIEKRYEDDDPEIEKKIRSTDPNCVESQPLDLQTENFVKTYTSDLAPNFMLHAELTSIPAHSGIPSTLDTLKLNYLQKLFMTESAPGEHREPLCESYIFSAWASEIASEAGNLLDVSEPDFTELDESELEKIAAFLTDRLEEEKTARWASYYSSFYWRIKGNAAAALRCLLYNLDLDPEPSPAKFQLATLYIRHGRYSKAVMYLESVIKRVDKCHECRLALADALVLDGNFQAAILVYEQTYKENPDYAIAAKKMALLRCVLKVFEEMENQHTHLLDTIEDVNEYKERLKRLKVLEALIEGNRASPEARLQSKLAYQYYTLGPMPHLSCRGLTKPAENGKQELGRLYCVVDNWKLYNESLINKYKQQIISAKTKNMDHEISQVELFEEEKLRYEKSTNTEMEQYLNKLAPFVAMQADEPQLSPKYPLNSLRKLSAKFLERTWPSLEECKRKYVPEDDIQLPPFFLSPENKGFIVYDFLTKYLALNNDDDISPLPWQTPNCTSDHEAIDPSVNEIFQREKIRKILDSGLENANMNGRRLKSVLLEQVQLHGETVSIVSIGDLGNRIALLLKYNIGPRWISANLAALFYRYLGFSSQSVVCIKEALKTNLHKDVAYIQLAEILFLDSPKNNSEEAERILGLALKECPYEPLTYFLLAFIHKSKGNDRIAEKMLLQSLYIDPAMQLSSELLLQIKCKRKMKSSLSINSVQNAIPRVCCWPNEADVYCFKNDVLCSTRLKSKCPKEYCFKLELNDRKKLEFIYYRCNALYTGKSYKPPSFAYLLAPLLKTAAELRQLEMRNLVKRVYKPEEDEASDNYPVFPLDYSDKQAVYAHQKKTNQEDIGTVYQYSVLFAENEEKEENKFLSINQVVKLSDRQSSADTSLLPIELVMERRDVLKYDVVLLAQSLPVPNFTLVEEGLANMTPMTVQERAAYCSTLQDNGKLSDKQPSSTYVSVGISASAKGVDIGDYVKLPSKNIDNKFNLLEPVCPYIKQPSSMLLELDILPAYKYHHSFKFYKPERGLTITALKTLGDHKEQRIEDVATSLTMAMQQAQGDGKPPHWSVTTASALYWRVKGDAKNAVKCLRHALNNSPDEAKDVSLISLANIYYQAGFLNSALTVAGKALEISPNSVVAIHFTLANIFESLGDLKSASDFYYSTLALQSNFQVAKNRIQAIYCKT